MKYVLKGINKESALQIAEMHKLVAKLNDGKIFVGPLNLKKDEMAIIYNHYVSKPEVTNYLEYSKIEYVPLQSMDFIISPDDEYVPMFILFPSEVAHKMTYATMYISGAPMMGADIQCYDGIFYDYPEMSEIEAVLNLFNFDINEPRYDVISHITEGEYVPNNFYYSAANGSLAGAIYQGEPYSSVSVKFIYDGKDLVFNYISKEHMADENKNSITFTRGTRYSDGIYSAFIEEYLGEGAFGYIASTDFNTIKITGQPMLLNDPTTLQVSYNNEQTFDLDFVEEKPIIFSEININSLLVFTPENSDAYMRIYKNNEYDTEADIVYVIDKSSKATYLVAADFKWRTID